MAIWDEEEGAARPVDEVLHDRVVAVLISDGFEQSEFDEPVWELRRKGARVEVLAQEPRQLEDGIRGMKGMEPARYVKATKMIQDARPDDYDALLVPGGALSVDRMRTSHLHLSFVRNFVNEEKPIAAICHAGWLLADAGVLRGRTLTSWPAIQKDLEKAGAIWKDAEVIQDKNLITSRKPADLPAFSRVLIEELAKGPRRRIRAA